MNVVIPHRSNFVKEGSIFLSLLIYLFAALAISARNTLTTSNSEAELTLL